jgi:hypothetical protein
MTTSSQYQLHKLLFTAVLCFFAIAAANSVGPHRQFEPVFFKVLFWIFASAGIGLCIQMLLRWPRVHSKIPFQLPFAAAINLNLPPGGSGSYIKLYSSCSFALFTGSVALHVGGRIASRVVFSRKEPFWLGLMLPGAPKKTTLVNYGRFTGMQSPIVLRVPRLIENETISIELQLASVVEAEEQRELEAKLKVEKKELEIVWSNAPDDDCFRMLLPWRKT